MIVVVIIIHKPDVQNMFSRALMEVRFDRGRYYFLQITRMIAEHGLNSGDILYIEG